MRPVAISVAQVFGVFFAGLSWRDPLAKAALTATEKSAGLKSQDLEIAGANCRFCRG